MAAWARMTGLRCHRIIGSGLPVADIPDNHAKTTVKHRKRAESKRRFGGLSAPLKGSTLMLCDTHPGGPSCQRSDTSQKRSSKLRQVDVHLARGSGLADAIRQIGVRDVTYFRWATGVRRSQDQSHYSPVQFLTFSTM